VERECSGRFPRRTLENLQLLVSELVTNRIVYGEPGEDRVVTLDIGVNGTLRCAVTDHGPGCTAALATKRGDDAPRGFALVAQLADRWGVQRTRHGTRVWFETAHV
jgi:anti-sigma regulatory factor (Ser/Thr protein kinase)